jgi:hypothetical protein
MNGAAARKRQRLSTEPGRRNREWQKQQTLTQIQWVPSNRGVNFKDRHEHGDGLEFIDYGNGPITPETAVKIKSNEKGEIRRVRGTGQKRRRLEKGNSTLTQMEFVSLELPRNDLGGEYLVDGTLSSGDNGTNISKGEERAEVNQLLQVDSTHESPMNQRRKRKTQLEPASERQTLAAVLADHDCRPTKRKRETTGKKESAARRTSDRIKKEALSDPTQNLQYINAAIAWNPPPTPAVLDEGRLRPKLEIQDTMDSSGYQQDINPSHDQPILTAETPRKRREIIPSSQSPESVPPSVRKKNAVNPTTPKRQTLRPPLREMSVNAPSRYRSAFPSSNKIRSFQLIATPSPKRQICVVELPTKTRQTKETCVEDSQIDIWSIQPTSSPSPEKKPQDLFEPQLVERQQSEDGGEIAETSQSEFDLDKDILSSSGEEDSLHNLPAISGTAERRDDANTDAGPGCILSQQASRESEVIVRDFALRENEEVALKPRKIQQGTLPSQRKDVQIMVEVVDEDVDDDLGSAFGTPIANDTQFNLELANRITSSPPPLASPISPERPDVAITDSLDKTHNRYEDREDQDSNSFLPLPTLIQNSTTVRIPLNDITQSSTSSSPFRPPTHRSIQPASLPHQSQISTQDPTQHYLLMSSLPPLPPFVAPSASQGEELDRITIKDSSSIPASLSQIPAHANDNEERGLDVDLDLDDCGIGGEMDVNDEHEDEYDAADGRENEEDQDDDLDPHSDPPCFQLRALQQGAASPPSHLASQLRSELHSTSYPYQQQAQHQSTHQNQTDQPLSQTGYPNTFPPRSQPPTPSQTEETQSNFTQDGHVTASRIARMKAQGLIPQDYVPRMDFRVPTDARELLPAWAFEGLESDSE